MKNVTLSAVVRNYARRRLLCPILTWRQLALYAATLALGLPVIVMLTHLLDPSAPLVCIVGPVLAGGLLPAFMLLPGRFEVTTRFQAHHLLETLDASLGRLGYVQAAADPTSVRYRPRKRHWLAGPAADIAVTLHPHAADIAGPLGPLRALQRQLTC
jgi:hypothetical protein